MYRRVALAAALACAVACGDEAKDPDAARSLAAGGMRAEQGAQVEAISNLPPQIASVTFNPPRPTSEGALEAVVDASDPDGNLVQLEYAWRLNGRDLDVGSRPAIHLPKLAPGDRVELTVRASDGRASSPPVSVSARADNRPPEITFLYTTPQNKNIRRGDVLTAVPEASDPENDEIRFRYAWRVNGEPVGEERELDTKDLHEGDKVELEVVASDGQSESAPRDLAPIVLANSPPVIKQLPSLEHQGGRLAYQFEAEDPEGDHNLRFFLQDAPEGMEIDPISGLLTWRPSASQVGKHTVKVGVKDSSGVGTVFEWQVDVNAAPPAAASGD